MSRWWSRAATALLLLALVVAGVLAAAWAALPLAGTTIAIDGETFSLDNLGGGEAALAFVAVVAVTVAALVVAAIAVAVGLVVGAIGMAVGVLASAASLALVAAPFVLVGWLLWRAVRPRPPVAST